MNSNLKEQESISQEQVEWRMLVSSLGSPMSSNRCKQRIMFHLIQSIWFISIIFLNSITNQLINKIHVTMIHEKLIFSNQSINYSNRYYYLELIKMNQFTPIIFDNAMATTIHEQETLIIKPQFQIFYYGLPFTSVEILNNGN
ncbi:unnamed protein product [Schistosoma curassoni]|uniref:Transmembrane protein n=1 Tax=Schistosoma curassoni TaxID=6186 RepID=A0A183K370_9TREM|nr:unnamed protein product [Schistosoma curassoni]